MSELANPEAAVPEHSWTEHVDTILRWRRFVIAGIGASWVLLLVAALLWPKSYVAEATIGLPNIAFAEVRRPETESREKTTTERVVKPGISIGTYKKVEAALADEATLTRALQGTLEARDIERLRRSLRQVVAPVTTGARDDLVRADREDTVTGVRLSYSARSERTVLAVFDTLASLVREALATRVLRDRIEAEILRSTATAAAALTHKLDLSAKNESIDALVRDLARIAASTPATSGGREVVDVADGGHRYLPAAAQLTGARAWKADNDFEIRQASWTFRVESLKVVFYRRLDQRLRGAAAQKDVVVASDAPTVVDGELKTFLEKQTGPESDFLRAEVEALRDVVEAHRAATVFVQRPSLRESGKAFYVLAGMAAAAIAVLVAALVGESWRRYHALIATRS